MDSIYERICNKLGCEPKNVASIIPYSDTEDDTIENPFSKLSEEEMDYLWMNREKYLVRSASN